MQTGRSAAPHLDKKRTVILLRSVVVISTSYLILFGQTPGAPASVAYILMLILTDVALMCTPRHWFSQPGFSAALLLGDTAVVLAGLYLTVGCFSQDFLIIYFFTIFLTTATSSLAQIAVGAALISGLYGYWLWLTATHVLGSDEWLRLPFFFIVAVFYAFMTEEAKAERLYRERAESESERLRFLFNLGSAVPQYLAGEEFVAQIGTLVQTAFPRLRCQPGAIGATPTSFALHSNGRDFGALRVETTDGLSLQANESAFCQVAALIAANALYTGEQVSAAEDGARIKEEFLATLSHELRSPLHVILGNSEILADALVPRGDAFLRESVECLRANACRLLDLVEEMLCFAELRAGKAPFQPGSADLRTVLADCQRAMADRLAGRPIEFEWRVAEDLPIVHTDVRKLRLVINGLLSNAAKFTEEGFIHVSAERVGDDVQVVVHDSGIGIEAKNLAAIFQAFRQVDGSLTRRFQGIGLGLALVQELTRSLGGVLEVESEIRRGSTFRVRLPIERPAPSIPDTAVFGVVASVRPRTAS